MKRALAGLLVLIAGCSSPPESLELGRWGDIPVVGGGPTVRVLPPADRRPLSETDGRTPDTVYVGFAPLPVGFIAWRVGEGDLVTGDADFSAPVGPAVGRALEQTLRSGGLVAVPEDADYVLETEIVHLLGTSYRTTTTGAWLWAIAIPYGGAAADGGPIDSKWAFLPTATVTLRLRLKDRKGFPLGDRVVTSSVLGDPRTDPTISTLAGLARTALRACCFKARAVVASWVLEREAGNTALADVESRHARAHEHGHTFAIHQVLPDRTGVAFASVACPSGEVSCVHIVDGVPLVGRPGEWMVSPLDEHGVRMPAVEYDGLTRHLAAHLVLKRTEEIAVYRYLGPRVP